MTGVEHIPRCWLPIEYEIFQANANSIDVPHPGTAQILLSFPLHCTTVMIDPENGKQTHPKGHCILGMKVIVLLKHPLQPQDHALFNVIC